jgi:DnaJ-class molecular chaperone
MPEGDKEHDIWKKCEPCHGDGILEHIHVGNEEFVDKTCHTCEGKGVVWWGETIKAD